jgi:hypothetical protein
MDTRTKETLNAPIPIQAGVYKKDRRCTRALYYLFNVEKTPTPFDANTL